MDNLLLQIFLRKNPCVFTVKVLGGLGFFTSGCYYGNAVVNLHGPHCGSYEQAREEVALISFKTVNNGVLYHGNLRVGLYLFDKVL